LKPWQNFSTTGITRRENMARLALWPFTLQEAEQVHLADNLQPCFNQLSKGAHLYTESKSKM
jgi:hypothetical protein